ncbi:MAG: hypothetical protein SWC40_02735 [Thermodesulfobacteriota bacterium]|nr:hypothetical protein [Thermodesulfobacteriota bacterium]
MKPSIDAPSSKIRLRKHLTADALVRAVRREFEKIPDPRKGDLPLNKSHPDLRVNLLE